MKKVLILGMGISGQSVAAYFLKRHFQVFGVDRKKTTPSSLPLFLEDDPELEVLLREIDIFVKSPGISSDHPLVQKAKERGCEMLSEIEIALREVPKDKKLLAITGSNGKTTTTLLTEHVLKRRGKRVKAVGNIGSPLLSNIEGDEEILVVELSSYQIEDLKAKRFDQGVILNITPNHLERYPSYLDYAKAKIHLQDLLLPSGKIYVQEKVIEDFHNLLHSFLPLPFLAVEESLASFFPLRYRDGSYSHDFENCRAAFALCSSCDVDEKTFWEEAKSFVKPPHRLEKVLERQGVSFINDSKATSVDAVIKGVNATLGSVILIAGGLDKGGSFEEWKSALKGKVRKVFLMGKAQDKIYEEIASEIEAEKVGTLEEALKRAASFVKRGETILFSPGCASFDQFQNFEHRGEEFKKLVFALEEI